VDVGLVGRPEGMGAMRAGGEHGLDGVVRALGQRAGDAGAARAGLLLDRIGQVRLLALGRRHAGVVRRLGRGGELGFQFGDARGQGADLPGLRLDLRVLRQHEGNQVITGKGKERCAVHALP
jgi:hypothetical protein